MKKIDGVVLKETAYIALWTLVLSLLMESVFLILDKWNLDVLLGNLISAFASILNFLLMGITIQNAVVKEEKDRKSLVKLSQGLRLLLLIGITAVGVIFFNIWSTIIPLFFPRIALIFRTSFRSMDKNEK